MDQARTIQDLAAQLVGGQLTPEQFQAEYQSLLSADLSGATLDLHRRDRCGYPEVVLGTGKPLPVLLEIVHNVVSRQIPLLVTRVEPADAAEMLRQYPNLIHNALGRTIRSREICAEPAAGDRQATPWVAVVTAGSSDMAVAEEARETLTWMGIKHQVFRDIGVAGPQRLLRHVGRLQSAAAIVVVAGMEGALPSVVAGHVRCPVFAVPTSVGYGTHLGGVAALLAMLNSCAANVAVCNIDAGFKGGYLAGLVAGGVSRRETENA